MKLFTLLFILLSQFTVKKTLSQSDLGRSVIAQTDYNIVYRGMNNHFEFNSCADCDSLYISSPNATINTRENNSFTVYPQPNTREVFILLTCISEKDTSSLKWSYKVRSLPIPNVYLGGINLMENIDQVSENDLFNQIRFYSRFNEDVNITNVVFNIVEWSVTVGKKEIVSQGKNLNEAYFNAIFNSGPNTKIVYNYCKVQFPDGRTEKVNLNKEFIKKSKKNTDFKKENDKILNPEPGG